MDSLATCINQFLLFPHPIGVVGIVGKTGVPNKGQNGNSGKALKASNGATHD